MSERAAGWGVLRPGDRVHHYYDTTGRSLCGRVGFYAGPVDADDGGTAPRKRDCKACWRVLHRRPAGKGG